MATADEINAPFKRTDRALGFGAISVGILVAIYTIHWDFDYKPIYFTACALLALAGVLTVRGRQAGLTMISTIAMAVMIQKAMSKSPIVVFSMMGAAYTEIAMAADVVLLLGVLVYCVNRLWDNRNVDVPDTPIVVPRSLSPLMTPKQAAEHL